MRDTGSSRSHYCFFSDGSTVTVDALRTEIRKLVGDNVELPEDLESAIGELYVPLPSSRDGVILTDGPT